MGILMAADPIVLVNEEPSILALVSSAMTGDLLTLRTYPRAQPQLHKDVPLYWQLCTHSNNVRLTDLAESYEKFSANKVIHISEILPLRCAMDFLPSNIHVSIWRIVRFSGP